MFPDLAKSTMIFFFREQSLQVEGDWRRSGSRALQMMYFFCGFPYDMANIKALPIDIIHFFIPKLQKAFGLTF